MMFPRFTRIAASLFVFSLLCFRLQAQSFTLHTDIGTVGVTGSMTYNAGTSTYTVKGAGLNVGGNADALHFGYVNLAGDGQIIAKVNTAPNTTTNTKVGIMIRDGVAAPGAKRVALLINPATGILYLSRASLNGTTTSTLAAGRVAPYWLKLIRVGTAINGYVSADGSAWQWVTSSTVSMSASTSFGMAVSSGSTSTLTTATFTNVSAVAGTVTDATAPNAPTGITLLGKSDTSATVGWNPAIDDVGVSGYDVYRGATLAGSTNGLTSRFTDTVLAPSTSYSYTVKARDRASRTSVASAALPVTTDPRGNPAPWVNKDVGTVGLAGSGTSSGGVFTVKGSGFGVGSTTTDALHFTYQPVSGDCEIRSRIPSISNGSYGSTIGVMMRSGVGAGDAYAMMYTEPAGEIGFAYRATSGAVLNYAATGTDLLPSWMKVKRVGNDVFFYQSATDGATWTRVNRATVTLGTTTNVGFAVGSGSDPALTTVTFDNAAVTAGNITDTQAPSAPVALGMTSQSDVSVRLSWADGGDNVGVIKLPGLPGWNDDRHGYRSALHR